MESLEIGFRIWNFIKTRFFTALNDEETYESYYNRTIPISFIQNLIIFLKAIIFSGKSQFFFSFKVISISFYFFQKRKQWLTSTLTSGRLKNGR